MLLLDGNVHRFVVNFSDYIPVFTCGSGSSMEQPTVTCHIIIIVGVIQTQSQDRAVPEIVRLSPISASAPRQLFDFVTCP